MRKTRTCVHKALQRMGDRLVARTCERLRDHEGLCRDQHGNWQPEVRSDA